MFANREDAGRRLARQLLAMELVQPIVLALPRGGAPAPELRGRDVVLVDDGIATGGTVRAAVQALRAQEPRRILLAVPVAATQALRALQPLVEEVVCVTATPSLYAIGAWYEDFAQVEDAKVIRLLEEHRGWMRVARSAPVSYDAGALDPVQVFIPVERGNLEGTLTLPEQPRGLVLFAHGSGSTRFSPRNRHVAATLERRGLATFLLRH